MTRTIQWSIGIGTVALALGGLVAWVHEPAGVWLYLAEPWLFAVAAATGTGLWLEKRYGGIAMVSILVVCGSMILRLPIVHQSPEVDRPRHLRELKGCALLAREPDGPIRIAVWTLDSDRPPKDGLDRILEMNPDIVVLKGTDRPEVAMRVQESLDGEAKIIATAGGGVIAATKGTFQFCGGEDDEWRFDLPARSGRVESGFVGFPFVNDVGVLPLMIGQVEGPSGMHDALEWPERVREGAAKMGIAAEFLGGTSLVVIADFFTPPTTPWVVGPLGEAGLRWAPSATNWPLRAGSIPEMGQHPLDQVWVGINWTVQNTRVLKGMGHQRGPIVVDLIARTSPPER